MTRSLFLVVLPILAFVSAVRADVTAADLEKNPLWLPPTLTLLQDVRYGDNRTLRQGTGLPVAEMHGGDVLVVTPEGSFLPLDVGSTDLLAAASRWVADMTEAQKQATPASIAAADSTWPTHAGVRQDVRFDNGATLREGQTYPVATFDGETVGFYEATSHATYTVQVGQTTFYEAWKSEAAESPRLMRQVSEFAVDAATGNPVDFVADRPTYTVFYHAAGWCGWCERTTPGVIEWFADERAAGRDVRLVIVSADRSPADLRKHLQDKKLDAQGVAVVPPERVKAMFLLPWNTLPGGRGLPELIVVDADGRAVVSGGQGDPDVRIAALLDAARRLPHENKRASAE